MTALLLALLAAAPPGAAPQPPADAPAGATGEAPPVPTRGRVVHVYDGDTFTLDTGDRVRVAWINTPEIKPPEAYSIEARDAARDFLDGREVELRYGPVARDGYGRLIASAWVDGRSLEEHLVSLGLAHVFLIPPVAEDAPVDRLLTLQKRARRARRGIWSTDRYRGALHITSFHANADGDDRVNLNGEYLRVCNLLDEPVNLDGYRLGDVHGQSWTLPPVIVPPGHTVRIHTGSGTDQVDPDRQLEIYLGSAVPIWNNRFDRATIYDRYGRVVDARTHGRR